MTTKAAEALYEAHHVYAHEGRGWVVFNPNFAPIESLPIIFGFNNGGANRWYSAQLIAEDGTALGSHICSSPAYMPADLGVLVGTRPDRHETFMKHYPDGYRMVFIESEDIDGCAKLIKAFDLNRVQQDLLNGGESRDG